MMNFIFIVSLVFGFIFTTLTSVSVVAQQNYPNIKQDVQHYSDAELAQILAPIALYPDSLLTHILIASTYPIEIIAAHRWLKNNASLNSKQVAKAIEHFDWDASVKALVAFKQIIGRLNNDLNWMQQLGDTFLQDESRVLASIQALRYEAKHAGNLKKMVNIEVSYDDDNIIIEPIKREVVYVPYYDTRMVYGTWRWSSYPPVYWAPHQQVYVNHHNPFYWHAGVRISFNYFFSTFHWHNRHVAVINPRKTQHYRPRKMITQGGYAKPWRHKPAHRRGASYKNKIVREKYYGNSIKRSNRLKRNSVVKNKRAIKRDNSKKERIKRNRQVRVSHHEKVNNTARFSKVMSTNSKVIKAAKGNKIVSNKSRNQAVIKANQKPRRKHHQQKGLSKGKNAKFFNRTKERHNKERH